MGAPYGQVHPRAAHSLGQGADGQSEGIRAGAAIDF